METQLLEKALQMPDAYLFLNRLKTTLDKEKEHRKHFYRIVDENRKMEFINGEIFFHSPVKLWHNDATGYIYQMLSAFVRKRKLGHVGIEKLLVSLTRNDYEPDVCFWAKEKAVHFSTNQMQFPAPDLVVEVLSDSTAKNDRGIKFDDYEAHKIPEYWIVDADKRLVEQYVLEDDSYQLVLKSAEGSLKSFSVKGFEIPIQAIFNEEINRQVLEKFWSN